MTQTPPCRIIAAMIADIQSRADLGYKKYGVTLSGAGLSRLEWLQHAYEEALDMAGYLRMAMEEAQENEKMVRLSDVLAVVRSQMAAPDGYYYASAGGKIEGWETAAARIHAKLEDLQDV